MPSIQETLDNFGFEPSTAEIYVILANNGEMQVTQIKAKTQFSRASIYDSLNFLMANGYLEYRKEGRNAFYKLVHPNKLYGLVEQKKRENLLMAQEMEESIRSLVGAYNLSQNKPGVRFFEGEEGFKEALYDTLNATEGIYAYLDYDSLLLTVGDINRVYVEERRKKKINKKILVPNTPENIKDAIPGMGDYTEIRILPKGIQAFPTTMQIYNDKISYLTLKQNQIISIIIENDAITQMQKTMFDYQWSISSPLEDFVQKQNNGN